MRSYHQRTLGYPAEASAPLVSGITLRQLKSHAGYKAAKAGDAGAAWRLVNDLVQPAMLDAASDVGRDAIFVPALALEATGHNRLPDALANLLAAHAGGTVCHDIVQANEAHHTGADTMERLISRPLFDGNVIPGGRYVLVDDVSTMGATLAEMADHIRIHGGDVIGSCLLVNASRSGRMTAEKKSVRLVEQRFGDLVRSDFSVDPSAMTFDEAAYLVGFRDWSELAARIDRAHVDTLSRLESRGRLNGGSPENPALAAMLRSERKKAGVSCPGTGSSPLSAYVETAPHSAEPFAF